jgi:ATP-dependent Zn protease
MQQELNAHLSCAFHEAGHAVADVHLGLTFAGVSIVPNQARGTLGRSYCLHEDQYEYLRSENGLEQRINPVKAEKVLISLMAGFCAEIRYGAPKRKARNGARGDFEKARQILRESGRRSDLNPWMTKASEFVSEHWSQIQMIASELIETKELDETEVETILSVANGEAGAAHGLARYRVLAGKGPTKQFPFTIVSA